MSDIVERLETRNVHHIDADIWMMEAAATITELRKEVERLTRLSELGSTFVVLWACSWARQHGLPEGHLHPQHYDLAKDMGANLNRFTRAALQGETK